MNIIITNKNDNKAFFDVHFKEMNSARICSRKPKANVYAHYCLSLNYAVFLIPNSENNNHYHL